jgi:predicted oxidoreductase
MVRLQDEGRVRSIGVCNFPEALLDELIGDTGVTPVVNQIELHPAYPQPGMRAANARVASSPRAGARLSTVARSRSQQFWRSPPATGAHRPRWFCAGTSTSDSW